MSEVYELPEGWEWKKLDDCTDLITKGTTPTTYGYEFLDKGINFLKIENIINGKINLGSIEKFISEEANQSQKRSILQTNDVLFSIAGTIGDTAIVEEKHLPMNTNQAIAIIRPKDFLDSSFLKQSLLSVVSHSTKKKQRGGAIKNISLGDIKNTDIPLPPLQEQKRIVAKLDSLFVKIDQAIALHQQNIDESDAFMGTVLNEVFGELEERYGLTNFSKIIEDKIQNGLYKHKDFYNNDGVNILRIDNFYNGRINDFGIKRLSLTNDELEKYSLKENDIVINRVNSMEYLGKCAFVPKLAEPMVFESNMMRISVLKENDPLYIVYMLQTENIENQISKKAKRAVNQCSINQTDVNTLNFPIPPLKTQQKTVQYLDQLSQKNQALKKVQQEKMQSLKDLKASLLDRAFRGEI
ncbi:MAG: restriction endonuclease subunit S [Epsilonproteobacteria bacterium]|nr:restriction endonuclease subunit S [Campylobacterota bacterium]